MFFFHVYFPTISHTFCLFSTEMIKVCKCVKKTHNVCITLCYLLSRSNCTIHFDSVSENLPTLPNMFAMQMITTIQWICKLVCGVIWQFLATFCTRISYFILRGADDSARTLTRRRKKKKRKRKRECLMNRSAWYQKSWRFCEQLKKYIQAFKTSSLYIS